MTLLSYEPPLQPFISIIYADADIVVINKQSGLLSVPGKAPEHRDSAWSRLERVLPDLRVVHRLDMATSGVMVFARHKQAQAALQRQFEQRLVGKRYRAHVWGQPPSTKGEINLALRCDWPNRPRQMVDLNLGKAARTLYEVTGQHQHGAIVALTPYTGRSHQLRVHMQAVGCAILGDKFYAPPVAFAAAPRLLLHAEYLAFNQPINQQPLSFSCSADF
ncbi:pseudouridine synthase [Pseudidiomarina donghaiensis]|uniref:Dual-specificity RNA pseudouridine synthase RluA n=1 Tax=Pseudidiomarina donghaiensis TaxID=519452 RepID=A0A432XFA1_9GAMM|nr:pseudouridine synthase [Pseudidiomarina donghaiensis]RUO47431.1 RNA pseudouridine synthase [Pseudidiomarina donghaiensis]SFV23017.1 tRNA pseudouridine32 synthase / 23S rRNA pseudouridine746 synthase [Pseudidiomarina donghaiensis]